MRPCHLTNCLLVLLSGFAAGGMNALARANDLKNLVSVVMYSVATVAFIIAGRSAGMNC